MQTTPAAPARAEEGPDRITPIAGLLFLAGVIVFLSFAPGGYTVLKTFHVFFAVLWVGGGVLLTFLALGAQRAKDDEALFSIARHAEWAANRIFVPSSFAVLGFGIATAVKGSLDWGDFWIIFGLIGWALSAFIGIALITPRAKQLGAVTPDRYDDPEVRRRVVEIMTIARFDSVLLLLIVLDMAAKPFL
ncbi:MAG TPA: DUF2269 family protein [Gaiellaceae bacterium]|jgi:uncharacterized membrane protein